MHVLKSLWDTFCAFVGHLKIHLEFNAEVVTSRSRRLFLCLFPQNHPLGSQQWQSLISSCWMGWSEEITALFMLWRSLSIETQLPALGLLLDRQRLGQSLSLCKSRLCRAGLDQGSPSARRRFDGKEVIQHFARYLGSSECFSHHSQWTSPTLCAAVASCELNCNTGAFSLQPRYFWETTANFIKRHFSCVPPDVFTLLPPSSLYPRKQNKTLHRSWMQNFPGPKVVL